jgi:hypothetical protein
MNIITTLPESAPLIDRVVDVIEHNPDAHNQNYWAWRDMDYSLPAPPLNISIDNFPCGTTACVAGWALLLAGYAITFDEDSDIADCAENGRIIPLLARELLRLEREQAEQLFGWTKDLASIRRVVDMIKEGSK